MTLSWSLSPLLKHIMYQVRTHSTGPFRYLCFSLEVSFRTTHTYTSTSIQRTLIMASPAYLTSQASNQHLDSLFFFSFFQTRKEEDRKKTGNTNRNFDEKPTVQITSVNQLFVHYWYTRNVCDTWYDASNVSIIINMRHLRIKCQM